MNNQPVGMVWLGGLVANGPWPIIQIFLVIAFIIYTAFATIMIRQVGVMAETFDSEINPTVKLAAWLHLLVSLFLVVLGIFVL